ncbi:MAG: type VI secretion system contractile sheath large subunit [Gammaproteobacteria bacterium]|nr:type VI secretion system contractile sheath large subunit [Gammaproteobacteria bacterium]
MSDSRKYRTGFEMNIHQAGKDKAANHEINDRQEIQGASDDPFFIAILGDFSGRDNSQNYDVNGIAKRRFIEIDRDNLDEVLAGFDINLQLWLDDDAEEPIEIPIRELDDFHPDQLFENVEIFAQLRSLHRRLKNNKTFAEAAAELQQWSGFETKDTKKGSEVSSDVSSINILDSILATSQENPHSQNRDTGSELVDKLLKQIVAPYIEPRSDPRQDEMVAAVEQAIAAHMQFILHHPDFQAMEASWRSLAFMIRRIETGRKLKLFILDAASHEIEVDLSDDNITQTGLYRRFCDPAPGDVPWGLIVGNYQYTDRVEDIMTLLQMGAVARKARALFITGARETLVGCESFAVTPDVDDWNYQLEPEVQTAWSLLRDSDEAEYLSMVVPGFLLRVPYGQKSKPIESFAFEEMPEVHCHSCYLWGNGAFIKAEQLARAFSHSGWDMNPADAHQIERLPLHFYIEEGEQTAKPCAEVQLTEQGGRRVLQQGLIPLWSVKNKDSIRSGDFHSLAV